MTWLLLIAGGLVTSTDSGLSVPDWPLSYGTLFPPMVGGIRYEHTHRLIAGFVALLIAALALWLRVAEPRRWVRRMGYAALAAVLAQALLGGLTVLLVLPAPVSIAHACLGQFVFCLVTVIAMATEAGTTAQGGGRRGSPDAVGRGTTSPLCSLAWGLTTLLGLQLVLGAVLRHTGSALSLHILNAIVVSLVAWRLILQARRAREQALIRLLGRWIGIGLLGQLALGLAALAHPDAVWLTTAHLAFGALVLAGACCMAALASSPEALRGMRARWTAYLELTKPRLTALALIAAGVGFFMGARHPLDGWPFISTLLGAALVGGGGNALNQWMERDADALMRRTQRRPLPTNRLQPAEARRFGILLSVLGVVVLSMTTHALSAALAALTLASYLGAYTPLKRRTPLCTLVGAVPGASPPLIGWAAARGSLSLDAWVLFAILFLWQLPHFLAIAWVHRDDYARAGFRMLPVLDPDGASTARQMVLYGAALLPISLLPTVLGTAGAVYFVGAGAVGLWFVAMTVAAARARSETVSQRLFLASVSYLPVVLGLMVLDRTPI
ncbi:MAG: protoheme IX farnesyltransferase [Candidatus Omnitrophica bacterium]|nr:protoheme IX farnesyltransferase [Candidatus Omnitrophota bacterium]